MAGRTVRGCKRRAGCRVRRVIGLLPSRQVASGIAAVVRLDRQIVIVVDVAIRAGVHLAGRRQLVRVRQRKTSCRVIKSRGCPGNGRVAVGTGGDRKYRGCRGVRRIGRLLPGREMATRISAIGSRNLQVVVSAYVAARAGNIRVSGGQREIDGRRRVVDGCAEPAVEVVTGLASLRELRSDVVWHAPAQGLRLLEIPLVTRNTSG